MPGVRDIDFAEYGATVLHPLVVLFMFGVAGLVLLSRRSRVILGVILVAVFAPHAQRLVIADLDFSMLRLVILMAWVRVLARGEYRGFTPGVIDKFLVAWIVSRALIHTLRGGAGGVVWTIGTSLDAVTAFFLFRVLIRQREQVFSVARQLAWIAIVVAILMLFERMAQYNVFSALSGLAPAPQIRDGTIRCKGAFSHPILAGTFGSILLPIFIGAFRGLRGRRRLFAAGIAAATSIAVTAGSSGPLLALIVGLLGWAIWSQRRHTRAALWTLAALALVVHLVREKPVWSLIGKISKFTGGTGYHRYRLIDQFLTRFSEWALLGTDKMAYWGWGLQDTTNQYVAEGTRGGLLTLVLFITLLHLCFASLRFARVRFELLEGPKTLWALLAWGFSVSLAVHCVSFISVSYFGQMKILFLMFLGTIPAMSVRTRPVRDRTKRQRRIGAEPNAASSSRPPRRVDALGRSPPRST